MLEREESRAVVLGLLKELAKIIGLASGEIRITVSDSKIVKIEARPHVRVCCVRRKENAWVAPGGDSELVMDRAPNFVTRRLESLIVALVGRFGYLETHVEQGSVTQLLINTSFRPPQSRPPRRRSKVSSG